MFIGNVTIVRPVIIKGRIIAGQIPTKVNKTPSVSPIKAKNPAITT